MLNNDIEKKIFRAGYECISVPILKIIKPETSYENNKFIENFIIRDIFIFLRKFDETIFDEYMEKTEKRYVDNNLSSKDADNAVLTVFENYPNLIHAYFLSKISHFYFFKIHLDFDLSSICPIVFDSFNNLFNLHKIYNCWPYSPILRESLYVMYESIAFGHSPLIQLVEQFYLCLVEYYKITKEDLILSVGSNLDSMKVVYESIFPKYYQESLLVSGKYAVEFDDNFGFYAYLRNNCVNTMIKKLFIIIFMNKYKNLPNLEKIKYIILGNSVTTKEIQKITTEIAPIFELEYFMKMARFF